MVSKKTYVPHHVMVIDTNRCIGCWTCAIACKEVNNEPLGYFWNRILTTAPNQSTTAKAPASDNLDVPWGTYPNCELAYLPVACQHCNDAPCVKVCPVQATFRRDDGTVLVDYNRCIGCRYCMAACPYGVRIFNWGDSLPLAESSATAGSTGPATASSSRLSARRGSSRSARSVSSASTLEKSPSVSRRAR